MKKCFPVHEEYLWEQRKCARTQIVPLPTHENGQNAVENVEVFVHIVVKVKCGHEPRQFFKVAEPPLVLGLCAVE